MGQTVEITFWDLCAFFPFTEDGKGRGYMLLPQVRRPRERKHHRHLDDHEPLHAHFPVVIFPEDAYDEENASPQNLLYIKQLVSNRPNDFLKAGGYHWFLHDRELHIKTNRNPKDTSLVENIDRSKFCNRVDMHDKRNGPEPPRLNPILSKRLDQLNEKEKKIFKETLELRVILEDGELNSHQINAERKWFFQVPGENESVGPRPLAEAFKLILHDIEWLELKATPFDGDKIEQVRPCLKPDKPLKLAIMNMTPEMYLGLKFDDELFAERERERAIHFKLFYELLEDIKGERKQRIPYTRSKFDSVNAEIFCPPLHLGGGG